jgi:hypothetical protein
MDTDTQVLCDNTGQVIIAGEKGILKNFFRLLAISGGSVAGEPMF